MKPSQPSSNKDKTPGADLFATGSPSPNPEQQPPHKKEIAAAADAFETEWGPQERPQPLGSSWRAGMLVEQRYELRTRLGAGGMGEVWKAMDRKTGDVVALKQLAQHLQQDPRLQQRFLREIAALQRLKHPNIVKIHDVHPNSFCYAMESLEGEDLRQRLLREKRLPLLETLRILLAVLEGLRVAHNANLIHRDLKPENIFLCNPPLENPPSPQIEDGSQLAQRVILLDFGIAFTAQATQLTSRFVGMGTAYYTAPELLFGQEEPKHTADIYSCGILLYEMLLGRIPTAGATSLSEGYRRLSESGALSPNEAPQELSQPLLRELTYLDQTYLRMIAEDPTQRMELSQLLQEFLQKERAVTRQYTEGPKRRERMIATALQRRDAQRALQLIEESTRIYPYVSKLSAMHEEAKTYQAETQREMEHLQGLPNDTPLEDRLAALHALKKQKENPIWEYLCQKNPYHSSLLEQEKELQLHLRQLKQRTDQQGPKAALLYLEEHPELQTIPSRQLQLWLTQLPKEAKHIEAFLERTELLFEEGAPLEDLLQLWEQEAEKLYYLCQNYMLQHPLARELSKRKDLYYKKLEAAEDAIRQHMHDIAQRMLNEAKGLLAGRNVSFAARSRELDLQAEIALQSQAHKNFEPVLEYGALGGENEFAELWQEYKERSKFPEAWDMPPNFPKSQGKRRRHASQTEASKDQTGQQEQHDGGIIGFLVDAIYFLSIPLLSFPRLLLAKKQRKTSPSLVRYASSFSLSLLSIACLYLAGTWMYTLYAPTSSQQNANFSIFLKHAHKNGAPNLPKELQTPETETLFAQISKKTSLHTLRKKWDNTPRKQRRALVEAFQQLSPSKRKRYHVERLLQFALEDIDAQVAHKALKLLPNSTKERKAYIPQLLRLLTQRSRLPLVLRAAKELGKEGPALLPHLLEALEHSIDFKRYGLFLLDEEERRQKVAQNCDRRKKFFAPSSLCFLSSIRLGLGVPSDISLTKEELAASVLSSWPATSLRPLLHPDHPQSHIAAIAASCRFKPGYSLRTLQEQRAGFFSHLLYNNKILQRDAYTPQEIHCISKDIPPFEAKEVKSLRRHFWSAFFAQLKRLKPTPTSRAASKTTSKLTTSTYPLLKNLEHLRNTRRHQEKLLWAWSLAAIRFTNPPKEVWKMLFKVRPWLSLEMRFLVWRWMQGSVPPQYFPEMKQHLETELFSPLELQAGLRSLSVVFSRRFPSSSTRSPKHFARSFSQAPQKEKEYFETLRLFQKTMTPPPRRSSFRLWPRFKIDTSPETYRAMAPWLASMLPYFSEQEHEKMLPLYEKACPSLGIWSAFFLEQSLKPKKGKTAHLALLQLWNTFSRASCKPSCTSDASSLVRFFMAMELCHTPSKTRSRLYRMALQNHPQQTHQIWEALRHDPSVIPHFHKEIKQALRAGWQMRLRALQLLERAPSLRRQLLPLVYNMRRDPHPWVRKKALELVK